jgi:virulence-associated protein VagC
MKTKIFKSGNSLAIRIPKKFASLFIGNQAQINLKDHTLIIKPIDDNWEEIFSKCYEKDFPNREAMNFVDRESLCLN